MIRATVTHRCYVCGRTWECRECAGPNDRMRCGGQCKPGRLQLYVAARALSRPKTAIQAIVEALVEKFAPRF